MKPKGYVLFIVLRSAKYLKSVLKALKEINVTRATVLDSIGSASLYSLDDIYIPMVGGTMRSIDNIDTYGKTIFSLIKDEETVIKAMDAVEAILNMDIKKPGKGIMFSVPIYSIKGVIEN
ncbi:hypothetical protein [Defluviitalea phaphyphila]|uniref:hypothetical protein n=1 Tax=Defluviitalea phaphyphila TaxID=1473580 RepID=UPI000731858F|nr:hypothetical protein [Defluviitalea phaphyphila]